jgi:ABC-2 type transport system ATP-binding protein
MLSIEGLRKSYGSIQAVDGIDLEVRAGETLGLLGPNGAGKSTTMRCALGVTRPDAGRITLGDHGSPTDPAVRRRIGYAPQELAIYDELTGIENLRFFGKLQGLRGPALREGVQHALDVAGFDQERARQHVGGYSGGMKRRLNLACAIVHDPELLVLDEPTVGVDPQSRHHLLEAVAAFAKSGRTVVYSTHYMEEAERLCDRIAVIDHGRILCCASVDELLRQYGGQSVCEAELDGEPSGSNELPGEVRDGVLRFETVDAGSAVSTLAAAGLRYRSLHVRRPDLEAVFLELTGRSLRAS